MTLATEQGFQFWMAEGMILRGWTLAAQGQGAQGIAQMRQGLAASHALGVEMGRPSHLALVAEAYGKMGQTEGGLTLLGEAFTTVAKTGERTYEAELYRLKGELTLQAKMPGAPSHIPPSTPNVQCDKSTARKRLEPGAWSAARESEACFRQALAVARRQEAKALELRAAMSLSRLWQQQGKRAEAHALLAPIYGWFTEGFDTADLQEAKALLDGRVAD
jgi:predicted ATPase